MQNKINFKFTDKQIKALKNPLKTITFSDTVLTNLKLKITAAGTKTFYVRFKHQGKAINYRIGDASILSCDEARSRVIEYMNFVKKSAIQPASTVTLDQVFSVYREKELTKRNTIAGRTHALVVSYNKHINPFIGKMPVEQLTRQFVRDFFKDLEKKGYSVHNRALTAVKSAFQFALEFEAELNILTNPFVGIKKLPEVKRSRYLSHDEAKRLLKALDEESNQDVADIYRIALFTGARLSNVKMMKWHDIDFSSNKWLIPATNTKTCQVYQIPLHQYVIELLNKRLVYKNSASFVFPSKTSKYGYITGGDPIWKSAIIKAGLYHENPNIRPRPHDLRRTFATWQIQSGADITVVSAALCHTSLKHTLVYARTNDEQVRESINTAFVGL